MVHREVILPKNKCTATDWSQWNKLCLCWVKDFVVERQGLICFREQPGLYDQRRQVHPGLPRQLGVRGWQHRWPHEHQQPKQVEGRFFLMNGFICAIGKCWLKLIILFIFLLLFYRKLHAEFIQLLLFQMYLQIIWKHRTLKIVHPNIDWQG